MWGKMTSFITPPPGQWVNYNVAQGILVLQGQVLLVGNDYGEPQLSWSLPGGRLEPGEQHPEAVVREVREETGLDVTAGEMLFVVDAKTERDRRHFVTCVFELALLNETAGRPEVSSGSDLAVRAVRWVPFEEAPPLLVRPSLGEPLVNFLYYGKEKLPRRYWAYPEYNSPDFSPLTWPPGPAER
jgi:8-oxo-dGTP diphosphatase